MMIAVGRRQPARPGLGGGLPRLRLARCAQRTTTLRAPGRARRVYGRIVLFLVHACGSAGDWCLRGLLVSYRPLAIALSHSLHCFWGPFDCSESDCRPSPHTQIGVATRRQHSSPASMRARGWLLLQTAAVHAWRRTDAPTPVARRRWTSRSDDRSETNAVCFTLSARTSRASRRADRARASTRRGLRFRSLYAARVTSQERRGKARVVVVKKNARFASPRLARAR